MTYLVDRDFSEQLDFTDELINPASVDLRISTYRRLKETWRKLLCKPKKAKKLLDQLEDLLGYRPDIFNVDHRHLFWGEEVKLEEHDEVELLGYEPILFSSLEWVHIPGNCLGILVSKSSFGRALQEHLHAGLFDPGFSGNATFEIKNMAPFPVRLKFRQRIVQLVILQGPEPNKRYHGRYQHQKGAEPIRKEVKS